MLTVRCKQKSPCDIGSVKRRLSCTGIAQHYGTPLQRRGVRYVAICPFHDEKSPSFSIDPRKNLFHCFGCGVGGGPIDLVALYDRAAGFPQALERAAELAGLIPDRKP